MFNEIKWLADLVQEARKPAPMPKTLRRLTRKYYRQPQVSKRRWKARCKMGRQIPYQAILEYRLGKWFNFEILDVNAALFTAHPREQGGE